MQATEKAKPGRKPLADGDGKTARVQLKLTPADKADWLAKAAAAGLTLQAWVESKTTSAAAAASSGSCRTGCASTRRWRGPALAEESLWCMHRGLLRDAERPELTGRRDGLRRRHAGSRSG